MFPSVLKLSNIHQTKVTLHPLHQKVNYDCIEILLQLIKTSIGPYGKLKMFQNIDGGHVSITSSSLRLFQLLCVKNTFLKFIISSVNSYLKSYGNGGFYSALLTLSILKNSLKLYTDDFLVANINRCLGKIFNELLQSPSNNCVFNLNLSNVSHVRTIIRSIVSSKPGCFLTIQNEEDIVLLLLKSFISAFPNESTDCLGKIFFHIEEGHDASESKLFAGILVQCPVINNTCIASCCNIVKSEILKVVIFSTSLAGDANFPSISSIQSHLHIWNLVLLHLEKIVDRLISDCIHVLFCQKVVHPTLKKKLKNCNILVIDRLGVEASLNIQQISGAIAISCLSDDIDITYGFLTSFEDIHIGMKQYLLLQNESRPVWTIFICNTNEETLAETKIVCQQAIDTLYRLLKNGRVCCGAGCTEIHLTHLLKTSVMRQLTELSTECGCSSTRLLQGLEHFVQCIQESILSLYPGPKLSFVTETVYGHLWEMKDSDSHSEVLKCKCQKYSSEAIGDSQWRSLHTNLENILTETSYIENSFIISDSNEPKIMDELCVKLNAFNVAIEVSSSLLNIGLLITP